MKTSRPILALMTAALVSSACDKTGDAATQAPEAEAPAAQPESPPAEAPAPVAAAPKPEKLPGCEEPLSGTVKLESYAKLKVPGSYWLMMKRAPEGTLWIPAEPIPEKKRHQTHLELLNIDDFTVLESYPEQALRFTIEATGLDSNMDQDGGKRAWYDRATASINAICDPAGAAE